MQIQSQSGPTIVQPTGAKSASQVAARDRAIAMLSTPPPEQPQAAQQEHPVQNPSRVSAEEMGAIRPPSPSSQEATVVQNTTVDGSPKLPESASEATEQPKDPLSSQYAMLARKEKALRAQDRATKERESALKAREAEIQAKEAEYQAKFISKDRLSQDPLAVLNEMGISYDQIVQHVLNQPKTPEESAQVQLIRELQSEVKALRLGQEKVQKTYEDQQTNTYNEAVKQLQYEANQLIKQDNSYELIKATNSGKAVVKLITDTWNEDKVLLTVEEAAREVEDHLSEEYWKVAQLPKIKSRFQSAQQSKPVEAPKQQQQMKTLTNSTGSSPRMTARERAVLAFQGKLKG